MTEERTNGSTHDNAVLHYSNSTFKEAYVVAHHRHSNAFTILLDYLRLSDT